MCKEYYQERIIKQILLVMKDKLGKILEIVIIKELNIYLFL